MPKNKLLNYFLIFLISTNLLVAFIESFTYYGFFHKHFIIPSPLIYLISVIFVVYYRSYLPRTKWIEQITHFKLIAIISSLVIVNIIESLTFPNFIFTNIHLNLFSYPIFVFLFFIFYSLYHAKERSHLVLLGNTIILLGIGVYLHLNVLNIITGIYQGLRELIITPNATYDEKMERRYGNFYLAMKMVQELTPENAILAIPPQENPWLSEGNGALVQYFIYPRDLTHIDNNSSSQSIPTHYLIAKGSWKSDDQSKYHWPKEPIKASRVWELRNREYIEYDRDYDPATDKWEWGLIEVKR